jgi:hypothetical protein
MVEEGLANLLRSFANLLTVALDIKKEEKIKI